MRTAFPFAACALAVVAIFAASAGAAPATTKKAHRASWGSSTFECTAPDTTPVNNDNEQTCVTSAPNARCIEKSSSPTVVQTCTITQNDQENHAFVRQVIDTNDAPTVSNTQTQSNAQFTDVTQMGDANDADVSQDINQSLSGTSYTSLTQQQDAHQVTNVCQGDTTGCEIANTGANSSQVHQSRWGREQATGAVTQKQDTSADSTGGCFKDICAVVTQSSETKNTSDLQQQHHLLMDAKGPASSITQKQYQPSGGLDGQVTQPTFGSDAQNVNNAHEHLTAEMHAPLGSSESQDPGLECCSHQGGEDSSHANIHQVGILKANLDAQQQLSIFGDCISNGSCLILSHGRINGSQATDRCQDTASMYPASCSTSVFCETGPGCTTVIPDSVDLVTLGFDELDFANAINFTYPLVVPLPL
jgi:hypothetical protein